MKIELLADVWRRVEKNEDGDKIKVRYRKGDVIDVNPSEAKALLREDLPKPMAKKHVEEKAPAASPAKS